MSLKHKAEFLNSLKKIDIEPQALSAVLDDTKAPDIDTLKTVLSALGCCLSIAPLETVNTNTVNTNIECTAEESRA